MGKHRWPHDVDQPPSMSACVFPFTDSVLKTPMPFICAVEFNLSPLPQEP